MEGRGDSKDIVVEDGRYTGGKGGVRFVRSIPSLFKFSVIGTGDVLDIAPDMG